ncbi:MAG TPA: peroxiredoxin [Candidatus Limnocylindria bacterium]|jgi:peroxiredoxin Q/BCP
MSLQAGDTAPDFTLPDQDGTAVRLSSFRGAPVVLYFYPADDTPGCTTEARQFNDNLGRFQEARVAVVGISPDGAPSHQRFRSAYGLRFPLLSDVDHGVLRRYGAWGERPKGGEGVIRSTYLVAADGTVAQAWRGVKADGHAAEVLAAIAPPAGASG